MREVPIYEQVDVTKGLLAIAMVFAHCIQLLGMNGLGAVSSLINLTCFSGFLFCFGFASWSAYLSKEKMPWKRVISTSMKCYIAFIIAASLSLIIRNGEGLDVIYKVIKLQTLALYSEFFLTFSFSLLFSAFFKNAITKVTSNQISLLIFIMICLLVTLLPTLSPPVIIGQFIGGSNYCYFPLIQYTPLFVLGKVRTSS